MDVALLTESLCFSEIHTPQRVIKTTIPALTARKGRDSFVSALYNDLFVQVVKEFSSQLIGPAKSSDRFLGVLDIFGFEFIEPKDLVAPGEKRGELKVTSDINGIYLHPESCMQNRLSSWLLYKVSISSSSTYATRNSRTTLSTVCLI